MGGDELLQLADELRVEAESEFGVDPSLDRREPDLLEPLDRCPGERLVCEIGQGAAAPEPERGPQQVGRLTRLPCLRRSLRQPLEAMEVELLRCEAQDVPRRACLDRRRTEKPPQLGDLALHLRDRRDGGGAVVEVVGESLDRDDPVRAEQEDREGRALLRPAELKRAVAVHDLERPQEAELEHGTDRNRSIADR